MSGVPKKVANWLYSVLQPQYFHKELVYNDIYRFLSVYLGQGFKIRTAVYTSTSGSSNLLVNLYGSLRCRDTDVPLNIWVPLNYPFADEAVSEPNGVPIIYVIATPDKLIRPGNNVDSQGRFYHPYLSLWHLEHVPGSANVEFNLLNLMSCLIATFTKDSPLGPPPVPSGPQLPPKPAALSPDSTGSLRREATGTLRRETTGPPLPGKPGFTNTNDNVPLKYRSPLPIPRLATGDVESYGNIRVEDAVPGFTPTQQLPFRLDSRLSQIPPERQSQIRSESQSGQIRPESRNDQNRPASQSGQTHSQFPVLPSHSGTTSPPHSFVNYSNVSPRRVLQSRSPTPNIHKATGITEIEDLMDRVALEDGATPIPRETLEQISANINRFLSLDTPDNINSVVGKINQNSHRVQALHSQLEHHNKQAAANKDNLDKHLKYLLEQVEGIRTLNSELAALDKLNNSGVNEIYIKSTGQKMKLDDIITPDLKLVHQLYDVTADIKACKDTLRLLDGGFKGEEELINADNLDTCVKAARGLGRELFWLEVTKQHIAKTMGLTS